MLKKFFYSLKYYDWWLISFVLVLVIFGIIIIYTVGINSDPTDLSRFYKQAIFALAGIIIMFFVSFFDYRILNNYAYILYGLGVILLVAVLFLGTNIRGTTGWFALGPISFQPVELAKIFLLIFLARFFSTRGFAMDKVKNIVLSALFTGIFVVLVILQPDLGSALIFLVLWISFLLLSRVKKSHLAILFLILIILALSSWFLILKDYQKDRIITFINPSADSLKSGYNVIQSVIAIGSGNFFGRGLGLGPQSQLNFLPEQEADFIFAVIAEELGFIGAFLIITLFGFIFYRLWRIIKGAQDDFTLYLANGILVIIFTQAIINIGMNLGLMPVTGLPLPFVSAGGSSLIVNLTLVGILESIYKKA